MKRFSILCSLALLTTARTPASILIDFDMSGRQTSETLEPGWTDWIVANSASDSKTVSGATFKISDAGSGTNLVPTWAKILVDAPSYTRLVGDGVTTDATSGGAIQLVISGLSSGTHTLLTYHNAVDGNAWSNLDVYVNGAKTISVTPTNRATTTDSSAYSYVTFSGTGATILYKASGSNTQNVILNAIALDVNNPKLMAKAPSPENLDWHVDADAGSLTLSWIAGSGAKSHAIYLGTDSATIAKATTSSGAYQGAQSGTTYQATGLSNLKHYWWRVDETDASGAITKGDVWAFSPRHLAFPGAEGYGRFARGGRGGKVVHVTSLADDGSKGTFRWAVTDSTLGPRTIVFDVGGYIQLTSRLSLSDDFVTVAGQTAPAPGICIRSAPFGITGASDVIVRFMKVRVGYGNPHMTYDGMGMQGANHSIFDHNTVNWTIDESFSSRQAKNITLQRTMLAEALNDADHQNYPSGTQHGYAASIGGDVGSFHHNLLANDEGRNWSLACGLDGNGSFMGRLDLFNNVVYNWKTRTTDGGCHEVNFVNNYYKPGPSSTVFYALNANYDNFPGTQQYYFAGNVMPGHFGLANETFGRQVASGSPSYSAFVNTAWFPSYATVQTAAEAYKNVLSDVGQTAPVLDTHDIRVITEVRDSTVWGKGSKTGLPGLPDRETDVGGFMPMASTNRASGFDSDGDGLPDWYEALIGTNPKSASGDVSDANADPVGDGYTNLERYLDYMATPHAEVKVGATANFDLAVLFRGYQKTTPSYKAESVTGATASVKGSTLSVVAGSANGIFRIPVTVTDKDGSTMTREVAVSVSGSASVDVTSRSAPRATWEVTPSRIAATATVPGTLMLRDLSGRTLRATSGSGTLSLATAGLPHRILLAEFCGEGIREEKLVQALP